MKPLSLENPPTPERLHELQNELQRVQTELKAEASNGDVAELARLLVHDFNNFLNNIVLSLAVLEQSGEAPQASLAPLRRQAERVSLMIKEFHNHRRKTGAGFQPTDLNEAIQDAIRHLERERDQGKSGPGSVASSSALPLSLDLSPELPSVMGIELDFARFTRFLLRNLIQIAALNGGRIIVATSNSAGVVEMTVGIPGATLPGNSPMPPLDSLGSIFPGVSNLELAACNSIARRSQAKVVIEARPDSGIAIRMKIAAVKS
jgi:signal transduction histidine kinase